MLGYIRTKFKSSAKFTSQLIGFQICVIGISYKTPFCRESHNIGWMKDKTPINIHLPKYQLSLGTVPSTSHRMISKLRIFEFSDEDERKYSGFCKYGQLPVMRQIGVKNEIISDKTSSVVKLQGTGCMGSILIYVAQYPLFLSWANELEI